VTQLSYEQSEMNTEAVLKLKAQLKHTLITIMVTNSSFLLQWFCLLPSGVFNNDQSSLNYLTASGFIA